MPVFLAEIIFLTIGVLSGGFYYRDRIESWPIAKQLAGLIILVATLTFLFERYEAAAKYFQMHSKDAPSRVEIDAKSADASINTSLQSELAKFSCYLGKIDGVWGEQSRRALSDFLIATGKEKDFGDTVKVGDLRKLFEQSPIGVCLPNSPTNQAAAQKRYDSTHDAYIKECVNYFLVFPIEKSTTSCISLKLEREEFAAKLVRMGVPVPDGKK